MLVALGLGLVLLVAFVVWERHTDHPMLPLRFFRSRRFSAASVALSLTFFALFGYIFLLTQYLQFVRGLDPLAAGLRLAAPALGIIVGAPLAPRLVERVGTKAIVGVGLSIATAGMLLLSQTSILDDDLWLELVFVMFGFGMGLTIAPATDSIMGSVPRERAGVGSAVNDTTRQAGGALGVAVLGSLLATSYNSHIDSLRLPAAAAGVARSSIGAALEVAQRLGGVPGAVLAHAARAGFSSGIEMATLVGAGVVACAALVVILFLPNRPPAALDPDGDDERARAFDAASPLGGAMGAAAPRRAAESSVGRRSER